MNALSTSDSLGRPAVRAEEDTLAASAFGIGLQLSRASTMALARLQLAIRSGDRHQAMAAMDRLNALDTELEHLIERLPTPGNDDPAWTTITAHVGDQKLALAFEKLALASEISGPDVVSSPLPLSGALSGSPLTRAPDEPPPPVPPEWPTISGIEPTEWKPPSTGILALALALLVTAGLAAIAMTMTGF